LFSILIVGYETENLARKALSPKQITDNREAHTSVACLDRVCEMTSVNLRAEGREETLDPVSE
jgi:hypothetical protein